MRMENSALKLSKAILFVVLSMGLASIVGCSANDHRATSASDSYRNQQLAAELTHTATRLMAEDPVKAEMLLRQAIDADLYHGPAHNNLGVLYLNRGELYQAAEEFDWARRLMPGHPDPRINLGLALERGGKFGEALDAYASAIEVYPEYLPAIQALARCQIRSGVRDEYTEELLRVIAYRGAIEWRGWARKQLAVNK